MAERTVEADLDDASDFARCQQRVLRFELEHVLAHRLGQEALVVGLAGACRDEAGNAVLDELLHPTGEGARGDPDLRGAGLDLLPEYHHRPDRLVGDLVGMQECRLKRLPH